MPDKVMWLVYVGLAGLAWGTYVPVIFYGGNELGKGANARLMAILCVGVAYFVIGVLFPLVMFLTGRYPWPEEMKPTGLVFAGLAGVAGAVGAICVIFATKAAVAAGGANPAAYRLFIAPLIFGLAPVINTVVSTFWHPKPGDPFHFHVTMPHPLLWVGILLVGAGAALVLYSKELSETHAPAAPTPTAHAAAPAAPQAPTEIRP